MESSILSEFVGHGLTAGAVLVGMGIHFSKTRKAMENGIYKEISQIKTTVAKIEEAVEWLKKKNGK